MAKYRRILVVMPTINYPERLKLEGILAYAHDKRGDNWEILLETDEFKITRKSADAIIAYVTSSAERERLVKIKLPICLIEDVLQPVVFPTAPHVVTLFCDHSEEGRTAAEYFRSRHFTNFAFIGDVESTEWEEARYRGFVSALQSPVLRAPCDSSIEKFLTSLPLPCAVYCAHDIVSRKVLTVAEAVGLDVPRSLAILGNDNDEMFCSTVKPALSSIPTGDYRTGYAAGRTLEELLTKRSQGGRVIAVKRTRVISRASTDINALSDPFVARTLAYARAHLSEDLNIETLARRIKYSKRALQLRTEHSLGHPLSEEIRRIRLNAAVELIRETDKSMTEIAGECGFTSSSHLASRIKEELSLTPLQLRHRP